MLGQVFVMLTVSNLFIRVKFETMLFCLRLEIHGNGKFQKFRVIRNLMR